MSEVLRDARFAVRQLLASPGFTVAAVLCLALGIGANAAAFSFARSFLFQPAPIQEPERLVRMYLNYSHGLRFGSWSHPDLLDLQETAPELFEGVMGDGISIFSLSAGGVNQRIFGFYVTGNYFDVLGVTPALGRGFLPEEYATRGTHPVTVISHGLWQRVFGGDPDVIGRSVRLNGHELTVVGVAPQDFVGHNTGMAAALWVPFEMLPALDAVRSLDARGSHWIQSATVRLRDGVTAEQARSAANALFERLEQEHPDTDTGITIDVFPESRAALHPAVRGGFVAMLTLLGAVTGFILLLACANVAGLLLARATRRRREVGIRLALGAGRGRLVRQLLTESAVLSVLGGLLGLGLAAALIAVVSSFQPPTDLPLHVDVSLDPVVLLFALGASLATGVVFGLVPALQSTRQSLVESLRDGAPGAGGPASRLRRGLVVGQVALSLTLLIAAGMVLRGLERVRDMDLGFDPDNLVIASVDPALQGYDEERLRTFWQELRDRLESESGVAEVGYAVSLPLTLNNMQSSVLPEGYEVPEGQDWPSLDMNFVDHGHFRAMGIPLLEGRGFEPSDDVDSRRVMVVNEAFAERFWPGESAVGKTARRNRAEYVIVGVVPTGKYFSLGEEPKPYYYVHLPQHFDAQGRYVTVSTAGSPEAHLDTVRRAVAGLDPTLPVSDLATMQESLGLAYLPARLASRVIGGFAALALLLATVGLYGVVSYTVGQQVREIGVRMALGARTSTVLGLVLQRGMTLTGVGLLVGLVGGIAVTRLAAGALYGVQPTDPVAYLTASAVLAVAAILATLLPARRAARVDPARVLRAD